MKRLFALLIFIAASGLARAEEPVALSGAEIQTLLTGNTIDGTWNGRAYRQFFNENGTTLYIESGAPVSQGRWKADLEKNLYCSEWGQSGAWSCYEILSQGDAYLWRTPEGKTESFTVLIGNQL